jgi:hypothetical protein
VTAVAVDPTRCPDCGRPLMVDATEQPALLRHGGYGATRRTVARLCPCGWHLVASIGEVAP